MSSSVEEVLSMIDDAITDWSVSPDAMRCNAHVLPPSRHRLDEPMGGLVMTAAGLTYIWA